MPIETLSGTEKNNWLLVTMLRHNPCHMSSRLISFTTANLCHLTGCPSTIL